MLKLAASISAPALAPKASEQEAEDASKTSLSNAHAHLCTQTHRFLFIPIHSHSFFLACTTEHLHKCPAALMHTDTQTLKHRPTKQDILARLLQGVSVSRPDGVPSYVNRSLWVTSICLNCQRWPNQINTFLVFFFKFRAVNVELNDCFVNNLCRKHWAVIPCGFKLSFTYKQSCSLV